MNNLIIRRLVLYDVQNGRADYSLMYENGDSDAINPQSSFIYQMSGRAYHIATIDNEICLFGTGSTPATSSVPFVTATLF